MKYESVEAWREEGGRRFGASYLKWRFRCPMCGHVASVQDFVSVGADANAAYNECIGRYTGKGAPQDGDDSGCNWCAYGLFGIPREHDTVISDDGGLIDVYPFAEEAAQ